MAKLNERGGTYSIIASKRGLVSLLLLFLALRCLADYDPRGCRNSCRNNNTSMGMIRLSLPENTVDTRLRAGVLSGPGADIVYTQFRPS